MNGSRVLTFEIHLKDLAPAKQGNEDKNSNMCTAFFF